MCCSIAPADFYGTKLYAGEALREGRLARVLAHRHGARLPRRPRLLEPLAGQAGTASGNAMRMPLSSAAPRAAALAGDATSQRVSPW